MCKIETKENKRKHLELIQSLITRMASNSFLLKGWTVTIVSAIFVLAQKDSNNSFILAAVMPIAAFWMLDSFFLRQERLFRKLYDEIRSLDESAIDFNMDTTRHVSSVQSWFWTGFSKTLRLFYGGILTAVFIAYLIKR